MSLRDNPARRTDGPADPELTMTKVVEEWIEGQPWLGDDELVMVGALRRFAATCDEHPHLVTAHQQVALVSKQLLARKPKDEPEVSALGVILEKAEGLRSVS